MFNLNVKMKFIQLKSAGMPMYKIANEIGVHRATIMRWNRELAPYILIARQDMIDELLFDNGCMRLNRVEKISRYLSLFYAMLDEKVENQNLDLKIILDYITKLTRLLMIESTAKIPEDSLKNDKDFLKELPEKTEDFDETVWVTDKEKFTNYQPDETLLEKSEEEITEFVNDLSKKREENAGFVNSNPVALQDISDKEPEIQEIFNRSLLRHAEANKPIEKCDNNVTMRAADV
jgi:hypothetical protein